MNINEERDRKELVDALAAKGIKSKVVRVVEDYRAVTVPLVPDDGKAAFAIMASGIRSGCEISLTGYRTTRKAITDCGLLDPLYPETLDMAVDAISTYLSSSGSLIEDFRRGMYDLPPQ